MNGTKKLAFLTGFALVCACLLLRLPCAGAAASEPAAGRLRTDRALPAQEAPAGAKTVPAAPAQRPARPVNRPVKDKWALVVGISKFERQDLNLKYCDQDARDFADFLVKDAHFAADHVRVLLNEQATRKAVMSELGSKWLPRVAAPDDLVVVFISSHGSPSELDLEGVNYILAHDSDPDELYSSGIDMPRLAALIKERVHSDRIVIILDACHSGAARAGTKGLSRQSNVDAAKIAQGTGQLVIASSLPDQTSWEFRDKPNSVFTRSLIEGFRKKGSNTTLGEAFSYMKQTVEDTVLHERGKLQTPVLKSAWAGNDLVLAAPPASPRPLPPLPVETGSPDKAVAAPAPSTATAGANASAAGTGTPRQTALLPQAKTAEPPATADIAQDIETDQVDLKRLGLDRPADSTSDTGSPARSALKVPLPDRVAVLPFSGTPEMERNLLDYMNNPVILLQHMVSTKLQSALGRRLLNTFDSGSALARVELAAGTMHDRENIMSLGRAFKSRFVVDVRIQEARFGRDGQCYFATILKIFDAETGDPIFVEGVKSDCPPFKGKPAERPFYIRSVVLPAAAEQITQNILTAVNPQSK
jgi:hypothetical protein